jgi:predicted site-specific integrase-resolvase
VTDQPVSLLDRGEAAARLHVSRRTVVRYGKAGLLDERRIGPKLVMVTEESVDALLRSGKDNP